MNLPKVLIVNQPFDNHSGGGITLTNLFSGWPEGKLALVSALKRSHGEINFNFCKNFYQIGSRENKWIFPFRLLQRKYSSGPYRAMNTGDEGDEKKIGFRHKVVTNLLFPILRYTGMIHFISKTDLSPELIQWLRAVNPDIIYAQAQSREDVLFCIAIHDLLQKPLVYHTMDDWIAIIRERGILKKFWHKKVDGELKALINKSSLLLSISDAMTEEYKTRYGKDFITFHNSIDLNFWGRHQRKDYDTGISATILYAGRTGMGIQRSLITIAEAIQLANKNGHRSIKLVLQTEEKPQWLSRFDCVEHRGFVEYSELPKYFSGSDLLLMPYDFSRQSLEYFRLSMPTKATEYMISGTPIVVFAPEETAIVKYMRRHDCAKIVTTPDKGVLSGAIAALLDNPAEQKRIATNAVKIATAQHNSKKVRKRFENMISSLISD